MHYGLEVFIGAEIPPSPNRRAAVERAWQQLVSSGPTLSSAERVAVMAGARRAWNGAEAPDPEQGLSGIATHWLAVDAEGISHDLVADLAAKGLELESYLEIVGVVARLSNIDWYLRGLGAAPVRLPDHDLSRPTGNISADARITDSWVPMLGNAMAPRTLDALPDEGEALRDLHEPMYIDIHDIDQWTLQGDLDRVQIEFIAARTSYLNECFY